MSSFQVDWLVLPGQQLALGQAGLQTHPGLEGAESRPLCRGPVWAGKLAGPPWKTQARTEMALCSLGAARRAQNCSSK